MKANQIPLGQMPDFLHFDPIPQWEFGRQRNPMEKPLFYITLHLDHIDPRVKGFQNIDTTINPILSMPDSIL